MTCPFCGTGLSKIAAICPSCKNQLPDTNLFPYYVAALARDTTLAQADKRAALDLIVKKETAARLVLLNEARERARVEADLMHKETLRVADELRATNDTEAEAARLRREAFFARNRKKLIIWSTIALISFTGVAVTHNFIQQKSIQTDILESDVRLQPCIALGYAAKETVTLINMTFKESNDLSLSKFELTALERFARTTQSTLLSSTIGQASDLPEVEGAIINIANMLGTYENSLSGMRSDISISEITDLLLQAAKNAQKVCQSSGFISQFNNASGWK